MKNFIAGTSGAYVIVVADRAIKVGVGAAVRARLRAQAEWLRVRADVAGIPSLLDVGRYGYTLERLEPLDFERHTATGALIAAHNRLRDNLWRRPRDPLAPSYEPLALRFMIINRARRFAPEAEAPLLRWLRRVDDFTGCTSGDTHGDPTLDNVLLDDDRVMLIDPLPPSAAVPSLRAVDLGKLLQSAHGYERVKYDNPRWAVETFLVYEYMSFCESAADLAAAKLWCAIHYLRLLPYQRDERKRDAYRQILVTLCTGV